MSGYDTWYEFVYVNANLVLNNLILGYMYLQFMKPRMKNSMLNVLCYTTAISTMGFINRSFCLPDKPLLYNILVPVIIVCFMCFFYKGHVKDYLCSVIAFYLICGASEILSMGILIILGQIEYHDYVSMEFLQHSTIMMIAEVINNMLLLILVLIVIAIYKIKTGHLRRRQTFSYIVFPLYQALLLFGFYAGAGHYDWKDTIIGAMIMVISMAVDVIILGAVDSMVQNLHADEQMLKVQQQRQTEQAYYKLTEAHLEQMKTVKQDLSDQIMKTCEMIQTNKNVTEIKDDLKISIQWLQRTKVSRYCENATVNSVLSVKKQIAAQHGIEMRINAVLPKCFGVQPIDLCSVYSNLLDNAIEACNQITKGTQPKKISIRTAIQAGFLQVKVENSKTHIILKDGGTIKTTKQDTVNHGYGLQLVQKIAAKYDGQIDIEYDDTIFRVIASFAV